MAEHFAEHLARQGVSIISGMAIGIDSYSQRAALKVGGDSAIIAIQPTKKEFEFVETNLSKQAALEKARKEAEGNY